MSPLEEVVALVGVLVVALEVVLVLVVVPVVVLVGPDLAKHDVTPGIPMANYQPNSFLPPNTVLIAGLIGTLLDSVPLEDVSVTTVESWGIS